jgi:glycosyltransferase involved in cell wall biosynthesis
MKISIITVCYNSSLTIYDTINSVNGQTFSNIEHIFIDGGSKDKTVDIINNCSKREKIIVSEKDKGLYDAMNKGIALATGDLIGILNSDDVYSNKNVITNIFNQINNLKVDSIYGDLIYTKFNDLNEITRYWKAGRFKKKKFLFGWMPPHPTFFVKKEIYLKFGSFNLTLNSASDYEIMLRFLYKESISTSYINEVLVKMRSGGKSNQNFRSRLNGNREDRLAWKLNNLKPLAFTFLLKPIRKISQFISKPN